MTAPTKDGVLVIDEHGDRKWGSKTAHIRKQYLANLGKIDTGVVSVTSLWADERLYYPLHVEPYTPAHHFQDGKADPAFRTKLAIAVELVRQAVDAGIPFRAVVADCFYSVDRGVQQGIRDLSRGYVLALKPSHAWWHPIDTTGSLQQVAKAAEWNGPQEQSYKQTRGALGWSDYQVRTNRAIRQHWVLVCCAFSFCWYHHSRSAESGNHPAQADPVAAETTERGENGAHAAASATTLLASSTGGGKGVARALDRALALLDRVVESAPTAATPAGA